MNTSTRTRSSSGPTRPRDGRMIAGVAAGLGDRFDLNPWWFRIAFLALTLFGGLGVLLYVVGWLLMPDEGRDRSIAAGWVDDLDLSDTASVIGVVLVAVALVVIAGSLNLFSGQLVFATILLIVGILLWRGDVARRTPRPPHDVGDGSDGEPEVPDEPPREEGTGPAPAAAAALVKPSSGTFIPRAETETLAAEDVAPPSPPAAPPAPPRRRSILGGLTMATLLIALGGLALADVAGWLYPDAWHYLAAALGVIGIGLVVGAFIGRARWLIVIGILLIPFVLASATVAAVVPSWDFGGEFGERIHRPALVTDLPDEYELAAGEMVVDLRGLDPEAFTAETVQLDVSVGAGEVRLYLPEDMVGVVDADLGIGRIEVDGRERVGIAPEETVEYPDTAGQTDPGLHVDISVGAGNVEIHEFEGRN